MVAHAANLAHQKPRKENCRVEASLGAQQASPLVCLNHLRLCTCVQ